jgi:LysM repeat protein
MYTRAIAADLEFLKTPDDVYSSAMAGKLKMISVTEDVALDETRYPFVLPQTLDFITQLAAQFHEQGGERLIVTSAARPTVQQPRNAVRESVHPTGMAVDFHRPPDPCLTWLRKALVELEDRGVIEATEERRPPHFHVAVLQRARAKYAVNVDVKGLPARPRVETVAAGDVVSADSAAKVSLVTQLDTTRVSDTVKSTPPKRTVASKPADTAKSPSTARTKENAKATAKKTSTVASAERTAKKPSSSRTAAKSDAKRAANRVRASVYLVEPGDNLSRIALRYSTTVKRLQELNHLTSTKVRAGQRLRLR